MVLLWLEEMPGGKRKGGIVTANIPSAPWLQPPLGTWAPQDLRLDEGEANGAGPLFWAL